MLELFFDVFRSSFRARSFSPLVVALGRFFVALGSKINDFGLNFGRHFRVKKRHQTEHGSQSDLRAVWDRFWLDFGWILGRCWLDLGGFSKRFSQMLG